MSTQPDIYTLAIRHIAQDQMKLFDLVDRYNPAVKNETLDGLIDRQTMKLSAKKQLLSDLFQVTNKKITDDVFWALSREEIECQ